ncbi:undecaprenyl-diphosphatase [Pelagirhabdus alkalitolerans]|uniref:Undecaprenyl-diphosphatase n=1 Tax=Pelagirhabdus alkalitolerans TaxID=1612202 RepID=A0A1G6N4U1_9BACI|nr:phosphatase PAP2 family protein [Pelagirhabdus alkalitolerans]SDC62464.1 undecaprenyl-diphosphatase [Pelagirhabdus alkalitolerans]
MSKFTIILTFLLFLYTSLASTLTETNLIDNLGSALTDLSQEITIVSGIQRLSWLGSVEFIFTASAFIILYLMYKRYKAWAFFFFVISVGGIILNYLLKVIFQRQRPGTERLISFFNIEFELASYSFPSGHTMRITILCLFLIYVIKHFQVQAFSKGVLMSLATVPIVIVGLSRLYLDAHYLTDVIAAISISIVWFGVLEKMNIYSRIKNMRMSRSQ